MHHLNTGANEEIQLLKMEVALLQSLVSSGNSRHFASIIDKGRNDQFNYLVMTLMGKSLQVLYILVTFFFRTNDIIKKIMSS